MDRYYKANIVKMLSGITQLYTQQGISLYLNSLFFRTFSFGYRVASLLNSPTAKKTFFTLYKP